MSNALQTAPSAVDPQITAAIELKGRLDPLRDALGLDDLTDSEMSLFAMVALHSRLDPFAKQLYAIKRKGKVTFQTGIDGFRASAEETNEYRGSDEPVYGPIIDKPWPHPEFATVVVHRQRPDGSMTHQSATAYWDEFVADSGQDFQWKKMPRVMLAKCAEAAAFRKAFPKRFGQVYAGEEMAQADAVEQARPVGETARDRVAAERARIEATTSGAAPTVSAGEGTLSPSPATSAAAPAVDVSPPAEEVEAAADPLTGEVIVEGTAVEVTRPGLSAGELREWLRGQLIGITDARKVADRLFGQDSLDKLTDAQRADVRAALTETAGSD